jgi:hypothetical protein
MDVHLQAIGLELADDIDDFRIAQVRAVLLEGQAEYGDNASPALSTKQPSNTFPRDALADAIVDASAGQNDSPAAST